MLSRFRRRERHGMSRTPEYAAWQSLKTRTAGSGPRSRLCARWQRSFLAFYEDVGPRPSPHHVITCRNADGDYELANVFWGLSNGFWGAAQGQDAQGMPGHLAVMLSPRPGPLAAGVAPAVLADRLQEAILGLWNRLESPHSRIAYRADWQRFCGWAADRDIHPLAVTALHVQQYMLWMSDHKLAKATRARALSVLRETYAVLVVGFADLPGVLPANPAREVKNPRVSSEPKTPWLAEDELAQLLTRPVANATWEERRDWLVVACLAGLGWRRAEIASLRRDHLIAAPGGFVARVRAKGGKVGTVPVPAWLGEEIDAWCQAQEITAGPVFPQAPGLPVAITPARVWLAVKRAASLHGVDPTRSTPHAIRRSFATITGQHGVSIEDRQVAMLHSSKTTTERYDKASRLPAQAPGEALRNLIRPLPPKPAPKT